MEAANRRLETTLKHITQTTDQHVIENNSETNELISNNNCSSQAPPRGIRLAGTNVEVKWNGWGYSDTAFQLNDEDHVFLTGNKYKLSGSVFPNFRPWLEENMEGMSLEHQNPPQETIELPDAIINDKFVKAIEGKFGKISFDRWECLQHGHGHTAQDIFRLRYGKYVRIPDVVIWPASHEHVETVVRIANEHNVCIIPYGGGTSVTEALECNETEKRMIVSLDMKMMNAIKWVDRESLMICVEAGATGKDLENRLNMMGLVLGHEPDSMEFSSVGGWVATRASGMKKNKYGNIEDMVVHIKFVTPIGTFSKDCQVPRISSGPDIHQFVMGSEGILGIVTEVVLKVHYLPEVQDFGSIAFPNFESGAKFMRELALKKAAPASIRFMDNLQFKLGHCLAPEDNSRLNYFTKQLKQLYITKWKGFDLDQMCAATAVFEGTAAEVAEQQRIVYSIAVKHGGVKAGSENGKKGYFMTFMIAYLRDYGYNFWLMGESFETSVPWANVLPLCENVKERIYEACKERGIPYEPVASCRITQTYDTGACIYFYFAYVYRGADEPLRKFTEIEAAARDEVMKWGGSISHHHGVGKLRKKWVPQTVSPVGVEMLKALKKKLDPKNILCANNLIDTY